MCDIDRVTIDILPGDVLLEIFNHYVAEADKENGSEEWQTLVHVCQKWRYVVFRSPVRLNLRILCLGRISVREKLALWPPLPIIIAQYGSSSSKRCEDNIIAALGHNDRVSKIEFIVPGSLLERVWEAMQKSFVALKDVDLTAYEDRAPVVSDSFLGGSAPDLRYLRLFRIPIPLPVLRKLLLSSPNLVTLSLLGIPHSAYFSPEALMVACLTTLTGLKQLSIGFESPLSRPPREGRHRTPTRSVLPALTDLTFNGVSEYFEDLVTRIDAPLLNQLRITFFHQLIFDTPQLIQFISRTPTLKAYDEYDEAYVTFLDSHATFALSGRNNQVLMLGISCRRSDWQLSSLAQVCTSSLPQALIPVPEHLYILDLPPLWQDDLENTQWLEVFHPFTTVKNLYLSREFVPRIVPTLQELVGERATEVLPNLQSIFLEEDVGEPVFVPDSMRQFIAARQLSSRPIAISYWSNRTRQDLNQ